MQLREREFSWYALKDVLVIVSLSFIGFYCVRYNFADHCRESGTAFLHERTVVFLF